MDSAELYTKILHGDEKAWEILQARVSIIVLRLNFNIKGEEHDDLVQTVLIKILDKIRQEKFELREPNGLNAYLFKIALRTLIDRTRKVEYRAWLKTFSLIQKDDDSEDATKEIELRANAPDPEENLFSSQEVYYLFEFLHTLPDDKKRLFYLKSLELTGLLNHKEKDELGLINNSAVTFTRLKKKAEQYIKEKMSGGRN